LLQRHAFRELSHLHKRDYGVLGSSAERAVTLSAVAPHSATDPFPRYAFSHRINSTRSVAVRNDTRIRHPDAKRILAFLDIAGIYARKGDSNPNLACAWLRVVHVAND
jgi:hypothetical protein